MLSYSRSQIAHSAAAALRSALAAVCGHGLILLLLWVAAVGSGFAQYSVSQWRVNEGLPQNDIRGLTQTPDGYLWIATLDGLARFDGLHFTTFTKANSPGIISNRLTNLWQGRDGDLWIPYERGGLLRFHHGAFRTYGMSDGINDPIVSLVMGDNIGRIWILADGRIEAWDEQTDRFVDLPSLNVRRYSPSAWGMGVGAHDHDHVYGFTQGHLLTYLLPQRLRGVEIRSVAYDEEQIAWIETSQGGHVRLAPGDPSIPHELPTANQMPMRRSGRQRWTVGVGADLSRSIEGSMGSSRVTVTFRNAVVDAQGNLWLGTEGDGLYRVQQKFIDVLNVEQGLLDRDIYPIYQDLAGAVWIGAWNKGVSRYWRGHFRNYTVADGLPGHRVTSILEDRSGRLWVGTHGGLAVLVKDRFVRAPIPQLAEPVQALLEDRDGTLWLGMRRGLARWKDGTLEFLGPKEGLPPLDVDVITQSSDGDLWFGGSMGLLQLHGRDFKLWSEKDGLTSNNVWSLLSEADGTLWIGTFDGGLMRLKDGRLTRYTMRDGLFNDGVFQILDDTRGHLWISCDMGIYRLSKRELVDFADGHRSSISSLPFGATDGLLDLEANGGLMPAGIRSRDGKLWFPTQDGVAVLDPSAISDNVRPPRAVIESILVDQVLLPDLAAVRLAPDRNTLEIHYTAPSFDKPEQIRFRYRLEGLDADWTEVGHRRTAFYTHVPPGVYTFRVSAANAAGRWGAESDGLAITILRPFYETWWFRCLIALAIVTMVALIWRNRRARSQHAQAQQLEFLQQLITSQENERKRIAGELHDSLGQRLVVINAVAQLSLKSREKHPSANDSVALEEIRQEALAALQDTRAISYDLRPIHLDRFGLTKAIEILVKNVSSAAGIPIEHELADVDDLFPEAKKINFYRIVQEALSNLVKYSAATSATVRIRRTSQHATLTIEDNGVGFDAEAVLTGSGHTGLGLRGMSERAILIGGELRVVSSLGRGTLLSVELHSSN